MVNSGILRNDSDDHMQDAKSYEVSGQWWKWSEYHVRDGMIQPVTGAKLTRYDPWAEFRRNAGKYRTVHQPYTALLNLAREREASAAPTQRLITSWCASHGLLGILPARCQSIRFRIRPVGVHRKVGGEWQTISGLPPHDSDVGTGLAVQDPIFGPKVWPLERLKDFHGQEIDLSHPPLPNSEAFWLTYGEPIDLFRAEALRFAEAVSELSNWQADPDMEVDNLLVYSNFWYLRDLAQDVAPTFRFDSDQNRLDEARVSPSLLNSLSLMALWDRWDGRRALRCKTCDRYFVSDEPRAKYCAVTCRHTASSRRYRSRQHGSAAHTKE